MTTQGITAQIVQQYLDKPIADFANAYFGHITDGQQRISQATQAVRAVGYNVGRGVIYLPQPKKPDVALATGRGGEYLKMKGKYSTAPRARAGLSVTLFPSQYQPNFSASLFAYGSKQPDRGIRVVLAKDQIVFNPDGSVSLIIKIYPDPTLLPTAVSWIQRTPLPRTGASASPTAPAAAAVPAGKDCFGFYKADEAECQACGQKAECAVAASQQSKV